jgi:hypothetical protein
MSCGFRVKTNKLKVSAIETGGKITKQFLLITQKCTALMTKNSRLKCCDIIIIFKGPV